MPDEYTAMKFWWQTVTLGLPLLFSEFLKMTFSTWITHFLKVFDELISKMSKFLILDPFSFACSHLKQLKWLLVTIKKLFSTSLWSKIQMATGKGKNYQNWNVGGCWADLGSNFGTRGVLRRWPNGCGIIWRGTRNDTPSVLQTRKRLPCRTPKCETPGVV